MVTSIVTRFDMKLLVDNALKLMKLLVVFVKRQVCTKTWKYNLSRVFKSREVLLLIRLQK